MIILALIGLISFAALSRMDTTFYRLAREGAWVRAALALFHGNPRPLLRREYHKALYHFFVGKIMR